LGQVTVTIAEKAYRIACEDGQEDHLRRLGGEVDAKIGEMRRSFGEIGDSRLTVMAAITFLDEREELRSRIAALEAEVARLQTAQSATVASLGAAEEEVANALVEAAERIESVARELGPSQSG
jgi:cell division protein ZapA